MEYVYFLIRITICFVLGAIIGIERQFRRKTAGLRTVTLVALGAFLFVSISHLTVSNDITRIAAQVVSGIGFLGAGVILRDGANIRGLNTAATLWCSAAIGTLTALGLVIEAAIGVAYILLSNILLRFISKKMVKKLGKKHIDTYVLTLRCTEEKEMIVKNMLIQKLKSNQFTIQNLETKKIDNEVIIKSSLEIHSSFNDNIDIIVNRACIEPGVISVEYDKTNKYLDYDDDYDIK